MLRSLWILFVWIVLGAPAAALAMPWTLLRRDAALLYRVGAAVAGIGLAAAGVRPRVEYRAPLPESACLFLANHTSNLDPPLLSAIFKRRLAMLMKRELLGIPVLGYGLRLAGFVPVARSGSVEDARQSIARAQAVAQSGVSLVIFPEGTRSLDGSLLAFKRGPFFLAKESGLPVVPVTIRGTHRLLPKGSLRLRGGVVDIVVHAALDPRDFPDRESLRQAVQAQIASAL